jgi:transposase-like protein
MKKYCPKCDTELSPIRKLPRLDWHCPECGETWTWDELDGYDKKDHWNTKVRRFENRQEGKAE